MLVLSREKGEDIMIGNDIVIKIVDVRGGKKVRLGITAPRDTPVHRREIWEAITKNANNKELALGDELS